MNNNNIFSNISVITLNYSADCNMMCKYCYIEKHHKVATEKNKKIRQALIDGSFVKHIIDYFPDKEQINGYTLWGAEPTINGDLFGKMHNELCDYFPNLNYVSFSTNALVGGKKIVTDFVEPIIKSNRPFTFELQFSLDGPPWLNDKTRIQGATQRTLDALKYVIDNIPKDGELILQPLLKATFDMEIIHYLIDNNLMQSWYDWYDEQVTDLKLYAKDNPNIDFEQLAPCPTFASPFIATVEDGKYIEKLINELMLIDTTNFHFFNTFPLFNAGLGDIQQVMNNDFSKFDVQYGLGSCSAGKNNFSFDYDGSVNTCHHIMPISMDQNSPLTFMLKEHTFDSLSKKKDLSRLWGEYSFHTNFLSRYHIFSALALALANNGQILSKYANDINQMQLLWFVCNIVTCFLSDQELTSNQSILPLGRIRFWGNGGLDALIKYYYFECKRIPEGMRKIKC